MPSVTPLPLWIPWILTLALALPGLMMRADLRRRPEESAPLRVRRRPWRPWLAPAAVMALVSFVLTGDRLIVTERELTAATGSAALEIDGRVTVSDALLEESVERRLGRDVVVADVDPPAPPAVEGLPVSTFLEVSVSAMVGSPTVCVELAPRPIGPEDAAGTSLQALVTSGACED